MEQASASTHLLYPTPEPFEGASPKLVPESLEGGQPEPSPETHCEQSLS